MPGKPFTSLPQAEKGINEHAMQALRMRTDLLERQAEGTRGLDLKGEDRV
jgi:hypothetical protein